MPFNGSGTFNRIYNWVNDKNNNIDITASRMDGDSDGFATGLSTCITKDGQQTTTAIIPFALGLTSAATITTPSVTFNSTSGIIGTTTNDSAAAGSVGEVITSSVAGATPVALTTLTQTNVTSISLTPGDWDVFGFTGFTGTSTTISYLRTSPNSVSATMDDDNTTSSTSSSLVSTNVNMAIPVTVVKVAVPTTYYLVARANFASGTVSAFGRLTARRIR